MGRNAWRLAVAIVAIAAVANAWAVARATRIHSAVTMLSPWVSPGGEACFDLVVSARPGADDERACFPVAPDAIAGEDAGLEVELSGPVDPYAPNADVDPRARILEVKVPVVSRGELAARRVAAVLGALCALAICVLLMARMVFPPLRSLAAGRRHIAAGVLALVLPMLLFLVTKGVVHPIAAAAAVGGAAPMGVAVVLTLAVTVVGRWIGGPPRASTLAGELVPVRREEGGDYRKADPGEAGIEPRELVRTLKRADLWVSPEGAGLRVTFPPWARSASSWVEIEPTDHGAFRVRFNDSALLGRLVAVLVASGPVRLDLRFARKTASYFIEDVAGSERFVEEFRAAQRAELSTAATR